MTYLDVIDYLTELDVADAVAEYLNPVTVQEVA